MICTSIFCSDFRQIVEVLAEVDANYVRQLSDDERQKLVENMINGGLSQLDKNSQYFNKQDLHEFETENRGGFGGIGIGFQIDQQLKVPRIDTLMPGSPAYEAGIIAAARDRQVGLQGMSTFRASRATDPPQLVIGFGDVADRAIEPGIAAIADLLT